jgi:hypothetical protein
MKRLMLPCASLSLLTLLPQSLAGSCPTPTYKPWGQQQGSTIYFNTSNLNASQSAAVANALNPANVSSPGQWNVANQSNYSNVTFASSSASNPSNYVITAALTGQNVAIPNTNPTQYCAAPAGTAAYTCVAYNSSTGIAVGQVTIFNTNGTGPLGTPAWDPSNAAAYLFRFPGQPPRTLSGSG